MNEMILGLDIGTLSSKGVLVAPDGTLIDQFEKPHDLLLPHPGWAEHDPEDSWWADFIDICTTLHKNNPGTISCVCVSGIGPCLLPCDEAGTPLRNGILYGIDTRATNEIEQLNQRYGKQEILAKSGSYLSSQAIGPKLLWIDKNEPEVWRQTKKFFMAHSFIVYRLTGQYVLDHHSASQCDPLYDLSKQSWIDEWATDLAPQLELPNLVWPSEQVGTVATSEFESIGLKKGTVVVGGTIDAWAEAASIGVQSPGETMVMYGTTMFLVQSCPKPISSPYLWSTAGFLKDTWTLAAGMSTSGALTTWMKNLVQSPSYEDLLNQASSSNPGSDGLVVLPYFEGERTPLFDPLARGVICGLTLSHTRGAIYRSLLEAIGFGVRHNLETMTQASGSAPQLIAVGGGTKGELWPQIVSDITGFSQKIPRYTIGASYGDAWFGALAIGATTPDKVWNYTDRLITPNLSLKPLYDQMYGIYRDLYPATYEISHKLAKLQSKNKNYFSTLGS